MKMVAIGPTDVDSDYLILRFEGVEWPLLIPKELSQVERAKLIQRHMETCKNLKQSTKGES